MAGAQPCRYRHRLALEQYSARHDPPVDQSMPNAATDLQLALVTDPFVGVELTGD